MKKELRAQRIPKREGQRKELLALYACVALPAFNGCWASEPPRGCFHSIAEAAAQTHTLDSENAGPENVGFRLEDLRRDRLLNKRWALVRSCDHPERPLLTIALAGDAPKGTALDQGPENGLRIAQSVAASYATPVVMAGSRVLLIGSGTNVRFETTGIAQSNGALGQTIRVRLEGATANDFTVARTLTGTVRSTGVLEWEP